MFDSKRFFEESWPKISQGFESEAEAESEIAWILSHVRPPAAGRVLDAPCGFGRHALALARRGFPVTGVDLSETELNRASERALAAGVTLTLVQQDMRDMEFTGEFDLALNLFSSIGYFSDDEDRLLLDRFCTALRSGGSFVLDTRNRDHFIRNFALEETYSLPAGTVRIKNSIDLKTSRVHGEWWLEDGNRRLGDTEFRLYSAHELYRMLRPERWSAVELFGGLDGRPFDLDSPRLVIVATK
ncbi:MAG TPA: class I SAM-dependent methyltransferase [Methylomirabilota bacterium]|nr:class I SAM-dependent methyltransferase [Methylomirabilota bacterium]